MGKQNATDDDDDDDMRGKGNGDDDNDDDDDDDWCKNQKWVFLPPTGGSGFSYENTQGINRTLPYDKLPQKRKKQQTNTTTRN